MAKSTAAAAPATQVARAQLRHCGIAPMKARRVIDMVRGMQAEQALVVLQFAPQSASTPVYKLVASALANAEVAAGNRGERFDREAFVISEAYVDEGPTAKRFQPRAQGRAFRIRKRTSHITVVVEASPSTAAKSKGRTR